MITMLMLMLMIIIIANCVWTGGILGYLSYWEIL